MTAQDINDAAWTALQARSFWPGYYAVVTTRIVCRHRCPARTPLRKNVQSYVSLADAVAAGFRPCKRCKPELATAAPGFPV